MTETEKRQFVAKTNLDFALELDKKADEMRRMAVVSRIMALQAEIAPEDDLEKMFQGAAKLQAALTGQQIADALTLAVKSPVAGPTMPGGELP